MRSMLNKPKFMSPSMNTQDWTIDADSDEIIFSCVPDGNETIISWRICIYRLSDNILVYETDEITEDKSIEKNIPFYPINNNGKRNSLVINLKNYSTLTDRLTDGKSFINSSDAYYWTIVLKGNLSVCNSVEEVFYANSTPEITVKYSKDEKADFDTGYLNFTDSTVLDSRKCFFKASYSQSEDIPLKCYGWKLIDTDSSKVLKDTMSQDKIYASQNDISMSYNGFLNGSHYALQLYVETQNNAVLLSDLLPFGVEYKETYLTSDFKVEPLSTEPSIMLSWENCNVITGHAEGDISFLENYPLSNPTSVRPEDTSVVIPSGSQIVYDYGATSEIEISENCYVVLSTQIPVDNTTALFSAEGVNDSGKAISRKLVYENGAFIYTVRNADSIINKTYSIQHTPSPYVWYIIIMSPFLGTGGANTYLTVTESVAQNMLYPSTNLYPKDELYPYFGEWDKIAKE